LKSEPNGWQSGYDFRCLMQMRALVKGNGYARIVRGVGLKAGQIQALLPLDPDRVTPYQNDDWSVVYRYSQPSGGDIILQSKDVFHLRGITMDGLNGISLVHQAREAIGLALSAERAVARVFKNGSFIDGVLQTDKTLSDTAYGRLRKSWDERYLGADGAGKTAIMEDGLKYQPIAQTPKDAQSLETRKLQIEEVARIFGVPRPLLMVDETSWGSGVEALGRFFVQYALNPWFAAWEQAVERSLLIGAEKDTLTARFDPSALLRGSMADQAGFFSKALGAGGQQPWMTPNEVRAEFDRPNHPAGDELYNPMTETGPATGDKDPVDDAPTAPNPDHAPGKAQLRAVS
jgi:HK97 family phage portal protein